MTKHTCVVDAINGSHLKSKVIDHTFECDITLNVLCLPKAPATFIHHANNNINIATLPINHWIILIVYMID